MKRNAILIAVVVAGLAFVVFAYRNLVDYETSTRQAPKNAQEAVNILNSP